MNTVNPKYKSDALESIHQSAQALYRIGAIDKVTMREFDESCLLHPEPISPHQIRDLREQTQMTASG